MAMFQRRPEVVTVEAIQVPPRLEDTLPDWWSEVVVSSDRDIYGWVALPGQSRGRVVVMNGDWIIRDEHKVIYPLDATTFAERFEAIS